MNIGKETDARAAAEFSGQVSALGTMRRKCIKEIVKAMEYMVSFVGFLLRTF